MSMTVDSASYLTGARRNTQISTAEKQAQKAPASDTGRTQESRVSASLDQVDLGADGIAVTQVSRQQGAEPSAAEKRSAAPQRDTVEISEEGRAASAKLQAQTAKAAPAEEETPYEVEDLSEYTDTELKQMYYNGEITLQEYEDETGETLE